MYGDNMAYADDVADAIKIMNMAEQADLVLLNVYKYHFINVMSPAEQTTLLEHSTQQLERSIERVSVEIAKASGMHDVTDRRMALRWGILIRKRDTLINQLRRIILHLHQR
jgi:hypothetical protein